MNNFQNSKQSKQQIFKANNLPRRNHYVPQFYLRNFSHDGKFIYQLDKKTGEIKSLPIHTIGLKKNLYTFETIDHTEDSLEGIFSIMETYAASAINKLKNRDSLSNQEKADLSYFIAVQMLRTPASQNEMIGSQSELMEKVIRMNIKMTSPEKYQKILAKKGKNVDLDEAKDLIDFATNEERSKLTVDIPHNMWLSQMMELSTNVCRIIQICDWEIRHSITKFGFLTSDHPFMLIPGEKSPPFFGIGLLTPKVKKIIPLAADVYFIAHEPSKKQIIIHTEADKGFARQVNKWTTGNAERYVFSSDFGKIEKIIKQNKDLQKTPKRYVVN